MSWLGFTTDALATYRITRLVTQDTLLDGLRERVWEHHDPHDTKIGYLLTCPYCVSVWAGAAIALSRTPSDGVVGGTLLSVLRNTLALSGAVALVHEVLDRTG